LSRSKSAASDAAPRLPHQEEPGVGKPDPAAGQTGDDQRDKVYEAAWERAGGLDQGLLRAVADAAKIPGGAVVFLDHDDEDFPKRWEIEPLASGTPTPE
jgi:hypothetical protein